MSVTPGALVPLTQTFVQSGTTTAIALVGQVLDNGKTNFVGYDQGSADYLFTTSEANAKETTLADHMTYWVSEGKAPGGYLYTGDASAGSSGAMQTGASTTGGDSGSSSAGMSSSSGSVTSQLPLETPTSSGGSGDSSQTASAAQTSSTKTGAASKLSVGAYFGVALGLLAVFSL